MSIKLIALDIDGTILNSHQQLLEEVKTTLQQKRKEGVRIVLCTGRPEMGVMPLLQEIGLTTEDDYIITFNGAIVQNVATKEVLIEHTLSIDDFYRFAYLSQKLNIHMHTEDKDHLYTFNRDISEYTVYESSLTKMPLHYRAINEMPMDMEISKMMFIDTPEKLNHAIQHIPSHYFDEYELVHSMPFFFEILNKKATKGNALKDLAEKLNIKQEEVMAIGDQMNDKSMIEYAGQGIAMGNAVEAIKNIAQHVTKTNDEAGVAYAIKKWA